MKYKNIITPKAGEKISFDKNGKINVPDNPIIPFIEGDGIGTDISPATIKVVDHAVKTASVSYTHLTLPTSQLV